MTTRPLKHTALAVCFFVCGQRLVTFIARGVYVRTDKAHIRTHDGTTPQGAVFFLLLAAHPPARQLLPSRQWSGGSRNPLTKQAESAQPPPVMPVGTMRFSPLTRPTPASPRRAHASGWSLGTSPIWGKDWALRARAGLLGASAEGRRSSNRSEPTGGVIASPYHRRPGGGPSPS